MWCGQENLEVFQSPDVAVDSAVLDPNTGTADGNFSLAEDYAAKFEPQISHPPRVVVRLPEKSQLRYGYFQFSIIIRSLDRPSNWG